MKNFQFREGRWVDGAGRSVKTFLLQSDLKYMLFSVPYEILEEAYKEYSAQYGSRQSLDRVVERGGFGVVELIGLLFERCQRLEKLPEKTS